MKQPVWIVYAVFAESQRRPDKRLTIPAASKVLDAVQDLLDEAEKQHLVGVLGPCKSKWID